MRRSSEMELIAENKDDKDNEKQQEAVAINEAELRLIFCQMSAAVRLPLHSDETKI